LQALRDLISENRRRVTVAAALAGETRAH
jgi:hypothetical protein